MKIITYISAVLAAVSVLFGCSGNLDSSALPELTVDDSEIDLATESQAVFTVTYNGQDVTSESKIYSTLSSIELQGNIYAPEKEGEHVFVAEYAGMTSEPVKVKVTDSGSAAVESRFDRHVSVIEFTGAWCINCPEGYDKMMGILNNNPQLTKYKENIHLCAFHSDAEGKDTLAIPQTQDVFKLFKGLAYPSFATDLRVSGVLTDDGVANFRPSIEAAFTEYLPHCGVAVSSAVADGKAEVTVRLTSEKSSQYRIVVLVVQDKIRGYQVTPTYSGGWGDYNHRHVVRKVVTAYADTFTGEKLTEDGHVAAGQEVSKTWTVDIDGRWVLENTEIYALALDAEGYVNNMNVCSIDGGDSGYDMK